MRNVEIFRATRGGGKTKWLVGKAIAAYENGVTPVYVGSQQSFERVQRLWRFETGTVCPLRHIATYSPGESEECCALTDELFANLREVSDWQNVIFGKDIPWYITMDSEDFAD